MRRVTMPSFTVREFASRGVTMADARVDEPVAGFAVDLATYAAGALLGRHPAPVWQLLAVVTGEGWAAGADDEPVRLRAGDAVLWEPGEEHSSGSDDGMIAVLVQSEVPPLAP